MGTPEQVDAEMEELYERMKEVLPRAPTVFLQMLRKYGGVEAARRLVDRQEPTRTCLKLIELGHPELTVEALVAKPEYSSLFPAEVRKKAASRLLT